MHQLSFLLIAALLVLDGLGGQLIVLAQPANAPAARQSIDEAKLRAAGIRVLTSQHLILYTDLPSDPEVDRLPAVFDQAVPQWAKYFEIDPAKTRDWQATGCLIKDRKRFEQLGLMPRGSAADFVNGISHNDHLWIDEQPTAYYRRHLLLHEGTHVFMTTFVGGCGPGWYMEGMAELLATHRLDDAGRLTLRIMPADRDEVAMLGRIKLIRDAVAAGRPLDLPQVMLIDNRKILENEAYAWSWAAASLLDSEPRYRDRFRGLTKYVRDVRFNEFFRRDFDADWSDLNAEWAAFVATLDHGYDFERMAIEFRRGERLAAGRPAAATIRADRGWQGSGVWLAAGQEYKLTAAGRFQIAEEKGDDGRAQAWPCEPGGVTIEYYDGQPLGRLLGAIDNRDGPAAGEGLAHPFPVGLGTTIRPPASGTLYLRVNDSAGRLDDNRGTLTSTIEAK